MPDLVASHWNAAGDMNGTLPKFEGLFLIPLLMYGFCALLLVFPRIDPLRENYRKFQDYYEGFILVFAVFLFIVQLQIILWGMGIHVSPNVTMPVMIGILFIYTGFLLEHAEPNWFVGIRTPWTLSRYDRMEEDTPERCDTLQTGGCCEPDRCARRNIRVAVHPCPGDCGCSLYGRVFVQ